MKMTIPTMRSPYRPRWTNGNRAQRNSPRRGRGSAPHDRSQNGPASAQHRHDDHLDREQNRKGRFRVDVVDVPGVGGPGDAGRDRGEDEGGRLRARRGDAHRLRPGLVLADGEKVEAEPRLGDDVREGDRAERRDPEEKESPAGRKEIRERDSRSSSRERLPGAGGDADGFRSAQHGDGEVGAFEPERDGAEDQGEDGGGRPRDERCGQPPRPPFVTRREAV